jgi:hypothetical protein
VDRKAGKHSFFAKKKQKTFDYFAFDSPGETEAENSQSFLVLFFKKEPLALLEGRR